MVRTAMQSNKKDTKVATILYQVRAQSNLLPLVGNG